MPADATVPTPAPKTPNAAMPAVPAPVADMPAPVVPPAISTAPVVAVVDTPVAPAAPQLVPVPSVPAPQPVATMPSPEPVINASSTPTVVAPATTPQPDERTRKILAVLTKIVSSVSDSARPHPRGGGNEALKQIDLLDYTNEGMAYRMAVGYNTATLDNNLTLSLESPSDTIVPVTGNESSDPQPQMRKIQDFLYARDAVSVPVTEADYTFVYDYELSGVATSYEATTGQIDQLLGFLVEANVAKRNDKGEFVKGTKLSELMPELSELKPV